MMNQFKDAQSFVDQEEQMIDKSRLRLHGHLLIKKNGFFTDQLEDAQSIVDPEEWRIGKSLLRLHDHLLSKKD